jgi:uncharacterized protein YjiS (DUF1127 family)
MITGNSVKYLLEPSNKARSATEFDDPAQSRMSSEEARKAAQNLEHPLRLILRWLTPAFLAAAIERRQKQRHLNRARVRLSGLSLHLLDDVGMVEADLRGTTQRRMKRAPDLNLPVKDGQPTRQPDIRVAAE